METPWDWRKAGAGWHLQPDLDAGHRLFHAYDVNDNAACEAAKGLQVSCEEPNEGSELCPSCVRFVEANPAGREQTGWAAPDKVASR